mmetsp:Transcript_50142/g.119366  ORF Transcript_50142/g.119366 Transcript_50142/m.119366 type:complete len:93 (+) Transcript_50142:881-1159(+)
MIRISIPRTGSAARAMVKRGQRAAEAAVRRHPTEGLAAGTELLQLSMLRGLLPTDVSQVACLRLVELSARGEFGELAVLSCGSLRLSQFCPP